MYGVTCGRFGCNGHPRLKIDFYLHEYEELKEYNPNDWNSYPEVTPPDGVLMRVETEDDVKICGYLDYLDNCWHYSDGTPFDIENVKRFRPWE